MVVFYLNVNLVVTYTYPAFDHRNVCGKVNFQLKLAGNKTEDFHRIKRHFSENSFTILVNRQLEFFYIFLILFYEAVEESIKCRLRR